MLTKTRKYVFTLRLPLFEERITASKIFYQKCQRLQFLASIYIDEVKVAFQSESNLNLPAILTTSLNCDRKILKQKFAKIVITFKTDIARL